MVGENAANSAVEEDSTEIRAGAEAKVLERERVKAEARAWAEAYIRE